MKSIDLNADIGEGMPFDVELLKIVSSASIACGGHAGTVQTMHTALSAAKKCNVVTGAHPGFVDPEHFGRRKLDLPISTICAQILAQIDEIWSVGNGVGQPISYVKLHGALYNMASEDYDLSFAIFAAVKQKFPIPSILAPDASAQLKAAQSLGMPTITEAFSDRAYIADGTLMSREHVGAVHTDVNQIVKQAVCIAREGSAPLANGDYLQIKAQSLCLHGDSEGALTNARAVRAGLEQAGIAISAA